MEIGGFTVFDELIPPSAFCAPLDHIPKGSGKKLRSLLTEMCYS